MVTTTSPKYCKRGHALVEGNLYIQPGNGGRACLQCRRLYQASVRKGPGHQRHEMGVPPLPEPNPVAVLWDGYQLARGPKVSILAAVESLRIAHFNRRGQPPTVVIATAARVAEWEGWLETVLARRAAGDHLTRLEEALVEITVRHPQGRHEPTCLDGSVFYTR